MSKLDFEDLFDLVLSIFDDSDGNKHLWFMNMEQSIDHPRKTEIIEWIRDSDHQPWIAGGTLGYEGIWKKDFKTFYERL